VGPATPRAFGLRSPWDEALSWSGWRSPSVQLSAASSSWRFLRWSSGFH
jgi:hypothetical protein